LDTASVFASKFGFGVARPGVANSRIFIASITAVVITIALPSAQDATACRVAFELVFRAGDVAIFFVRAIAAVVGTVT